MGKQMRYWFFLSWKRVVLRPFFVLLLLLFPVGAACFQKVEQEDSGKIAIALFTDGDEWNEAVAEQLLNEESAFAFYLCETREELKEDVAAGRAECGYSFPAGLRELLEKKNYRSAIRVTKSPSTVAADLAGECVFAALFRVYGRELLEQYVWSGEPFTSLGKSGNGDLWEEIEPIYEKALSDGSTFSFAYETVDGTAAEEMQMKVSFPVRGIGTVFIFVMGLAAAVTAAEDEQRGLYAAVTAGKQRGMQAISIAAMTALSCASVLVALSVSGNLGQLPAECGALLLYGGVTVLFSVFLLVLLRNPLVISGLIPFFILGSLICCPIFADLSVFVPILSRLRYLFLPWYYLMR